ncbi:MAG: OmpA family protein, partial [Bdellovibrio bacteriovorus]
AAAVPDSPAFDQRGQSTSGREDAGGLAEPVALADDQALISTTGTAGSVDPGDEAGGIPLLVEELRRLGHRVRDLGDGRLSFDLAEQVPFASDSARMPERAGEVLDPLAAVLARYPEVRITLVGHTDSRGPADYNRRLSLSRARAVADYLQRRGVPEHGLATQGMGKEARLPEHESAARHRRVEVVIEPAAR